MRVLLFCNNWVGWQVARYIAERGEQIVGLVLHPQSKRKFGEEIIKHVSIDPAFIFDGSQLQYPSTISSIKSLNPEIGVSALFGYILRRDILKLFPNGCVNIHPSLLPYNRGSYPNVWSIVEETPAGVTIHLIDEGVDTGAIIAQRPVEVEPVDTGETLYRKLEAACLDLFVETWPSIVSGDVVVAAQSKELGTAHRVKDVEQIDNIELDRLYTARELLNILRARTHSSYSGAYFYSQGKKVFVRLQLSYEDEA